jgi:tetratricopeptide (TPR) repeat protein
MNRRYIRRICTGLCCLGWFLAEAVTAAPGTQADAAALFRDAYLAVVDAEMAQANQMPGDALVAYRKALTLYNKIEAGYPGWQTDTVGYRVADCKNRIAALEQAAKGPTQKGGATAATVASTNTEARLEQLVSELQRYRDMLAPPADAGRENQRTAAQAERELLRVKEERDDAVLASEMLRRKMAKLEVQVGKPVGTTGSVEQASGPRLLPSVVKVEARRLIDSGDNETAMTLLEETRALLPGETDLTLLQGLACCHAGKFDRAAPLLKEAVKQDSGNAAAFVALGTAQMGLGELGPARVAMEQALKLAPKSPEAHYNMAQILLTVDPPDLVGANEHYRQALALGSQPDPTIEETLRAGAIMSRMRQLKKH